MRFKNRRIRQARRGDLEVVIFSIHRFGPGIVPGTRLPIAVLGMPRIEPEIEAERAFLAAVGFQKCDPAITYEFRSMPFRAVRHDFEVRVAEDFLEFIEMILGLEVFRHLGVPFSKQPGSVSRVSQEVRK